MCLPNNRISFFLNRVTDFLNSFFVRLSQSRIPPMFWIFLLWFLIVVPAIFVRGVHYEEGTTISLARNAFQDGHWLTPFRYGVRFVERPVLISWLLGFIGYLLGSLPLWIGRLPMVLAYLFGAILIYRLVKQYASIRAAMFGSMCFLISPMMLQKTVTAEVDGIVSVMLFAGFVIWWNKHSRNSINILHWIFITMILCAASLVKGPQPLGYFFIGIGLYLLIKRAYGCFPIPKPEIHMQTPVSGFPVYAKELKSTADPSKIKKRLIPLKAFEENKAFHQVLTATILLGIID